MNRYTYNVLLKIAASPAVVQSVPKKTYAIPVPTKELALDVLGKTETGYDPYVKRDGRYDSPDNYNRFYIRTRVRGTHGDPEVPRNKWTSSTAWGPWQANHAYAQEVAKIDPKFAEYYNSTLRQMYRNMAKYGLSTHLYRGLKASGIYPKGYPEAMVKLYDYGMHPFDMTDESHTIVRNGMLNYLDKVVIPQSKVRGGDKALDQWRQLALIHRFGANKESLTKEEQEKFDEYWAKVQSNIRYMQEARAAWKAPMIARLEEQKASIKPTLPNGSPNVYYRSQIQGIDAKLNELKNNY